MQRDVEAFLSFTLSLYGGGGGGARAFECSVIPPRQNERKFSIVTLEVKLFLGGRGANQISGSAIYRPPERESQLKANCKIDKNITSRK